MYNEFGGQKKKTPYRLYLKARRRYGKQYRQNRKSSTIPKLAETVRSKWSRLPPHVQAKKSVPSPDEFFSKVHTQGGYIVKDGSSNYFGLTPAQKAKAKAKFKKNKAKYSTLRKAYQKYRKSQTTLPIATVKLSQMKQLWNSMRQHTGMKSPTYWMQNPTKKFGEDLSPDEKLKYGLATTAVVLASVGGLYMVMTRNQPAAQFL